MKKFLFIFCALIFFSIDSEGENVIDDDIEKLNTLSELAIVNNLKINHWQMVIKEKVQRDKATHFIKKVKRNYSVTTKKTEKATKYNIKKLNQNGLSETMTIIIPVVETQKAELVTVLESDSWNKSILKELDEKSNLISRNYFTNNALKFTCLFTTYDGIIDVVDFFNKLKQKLNLKVNSTQYDTDKTNSKHNKTIYGYTPVWEEKLIIENKPMNFQMAINETENGESKIVIGTPILVNEY